MAMCDCQIISSGVSSAATHKLGLLLRGIVLEGIIMITSFAAFLAAVSALLLPFTFVCLWTQQNSLGMFSACAF